MDIHSLRVLEFNKICEFLKTFAASPGGKRQCETLMPSPNSEDVESLLKETTEMRQAIELNGCLSLSGIHDIRGAVERSRIQNFYLEQTFLLQIRETIETANTTKIFFSGLKETCPRLFQITDNIITLQEIDTRIKKCISSQGEIFDNASPQLAEIRSHLKKLRLNIIRTLEQMINDENISYAFQDDFITLRNNRYVIPVRSDSKTVVPGVVHDQSQTKATFFIEPLSVVNLNNELQILRKEEYYEEIRILTELTKLVYEYGDEILTDLQIMERIDVIHARALFSRALNAEEPDINSEGIIELRQCRHPILLSQFIEDENIVEEEGEEKLPEEKEIKGHWEFNRPGVVPVDLIKGKTTSALIVTGANAGGKTVAMKTLGLFALMTQAGMHIPAEQESRIPVYDTVFADIGDEQNIEASLSTFSAHMSQIKSIVSNVSSSSLVLLDELGSGTDPSEGGALAVAILDFLKDCSCFTVITTHLNILKTYAYNNADVENVSVEFDPVTLKPTYNLVYGVPGISNALAIANNIGIPEEILKRAAGYIDESDKQIVELIHGLEKTQKEISEEKRALQEIKHLTRKYQKAAENLFESIKSQRGKILKNIENSARKLLRESEEQLTKLIREQKRTRIIRPEESLKHTEESRETFFQIKKRLYEQFPRTASSREKVEHLEVGQPVKVHHLQKNGVVVSVNIEARKAEVAVGSMRVKAGFQELELIKDQNQPLQKRAKKPSRSYYHSETTSVTVKNINVIGMRVDDALPVVDKAIDNAILQGADTVEIIHGRGTGRLMKAIHEHLKDHQYVNRFESGDASKGGTGVTIVHLKE
jgi:DNA mismatch repair protein MutS2